MGNPLNAHKNMQSTSRNRRTSALNKKNQDIDQATIDEAKRNGMSDSDLQKIVDKAEKIDYVNNNIGKDLSTYHAAKQKMKSRGNLDMGVEEVATKDSTNESNEKKRIMNKYGIDENEFNKHYSKYEAEQKKQTAENKRKKDEQFAKDHPVLGSLKSIGTNLMSGLEGYANETALGNEALQDMVEKQKENHQRRYEQDKRYRNSVGAELKQALLEGVKPLDNNKKISPDSDFLMSDSTQKLREGASSNINSNIGKKAYNIGMGVADQAAQFALAALTGGSPQIVGGLQGGQVANDMMKQSLSNGNSAGQSALTGLGSGAVTYGLSKWGADNIIDAATKGAAEKWGAKNILTNTIKAMGTEGLEEGAENIIDNAIDQGSAKLFKGTSNQEQMVRDYMSQGYDRETAEKFAKQDRWGEIREDALSGALVGGLLSGAQYGSAKLGDRNNNRTNKIPRMNGEEVEYTKPTNRYVDGADQLESKVHNAPLLEDRGNNDGSVVYGQRNRPTGVEMENRALLGDNVNKDSRVYRINDKASEVNPGVMYANEAKYSTLDERSLINVRFEELLNAPIIDGLNKSQTDRYRVLKERQNQGIATEKQLAYIDNIESNVLTQAYNDVQDGYGKKQEIEYDPNAQTIYDEADSVNEETPTMENIVEETPTVEPTPTVENKAKNTSKKMSNIEQMIRNVAQEGLNQGMSVDDAMENAYNTVIKDVITRNSNNSKQSQKDLLQFHKDFNKVNGEYINNDKKSVKVEKKINTNPKEENVEYGTINLGGSQNTEQNTNNTRQTQSTPINQDVNIDDNVTPSVENTDNNNATGGVKERSFPKSVDIDEDLRRMVDAKYYKQLKNSDTVKKANIVFDESSSLEDANLKFLDMVKQHDPASVVLGKRIADEYSASGDYDKAVQVIDEISKHMTRAGQFTQAAYITALKNNPRAVAASIENDLRKINKEGRTKFGDKQWNDFSLTEEEKTAFNNLKDGDVDGINKLVDQVYARMSKDYPHTKWEQLYDIAKHCMLLNPRTHIRNVLANAISMPVRSTSDRVKAVLEGAYGKINKDYQRTSSLTGGSKEAKAIASKYFDDFVKETLDDGGKWSQEGTGRLSRESQLFEDTKVGEKVNKLTGATLNSLNRLTNGKLESIVNQYNESATNSVLENIRKFDYFLLGEVEDVPFVKQNFVNALSNIMTAQNITTAENITPEAVSLALDEALKATFKDDNAFTDALSTIKRKTGKFGDIAMPFTKTPANLAMRGLDYSPAGLAMTFKKAFDMKRNQVAEHIANGGTNAKDAKLTNEQISSVIGDLSKNLTGTGMIFLGYALAKAGLITGGYSDDKNEKNYQKLKGFQPNAFHIGNKYYTYDWAQPSSIPLLIGTSIYEGIQNDDKETSKAMQMAKSFKNGSVSAIDAWFNLSPLKGVSEIMGGGDNASYGDGKSIGNNILSTVEEWPLAYIPSAMGAATRASDPTIRNTFDKTSTMSTLKNQAMSKIPGLSKNLPASYDVWGRERKRSANTTDASIAQFINPGTLGYDNPTKVDDFLQGIFEETKDGKVFPRQAEYSVKTPNGTKELNNKEYSERQKVQGQKSLELVEAYQNIAKASDLSNEENIDVLSDLYSAAKDYADVKLYGKTSSMSAKEKEMFEQGPKVFAEYMKDKKIASRYDLSYDKYMELIESGGKDAINKYIENREATKEINAAVPDTEINVSTYQKYTDKGASKEDILFLQTMKSKADSDGSEDLSNDEIMSYLGKQNMSDSQRSQMLKYSLKKQTLDSAYVKAGMQTFGESSLYTVLTHYKNANLDGKGTTPSKKEVTEYVNNTFKTQEERDQWFYVLYGAGHQKKSKK